MENYIDNAIVQEDSAKNTEPNAEIKKTTDQKAKEINRDADGSEADINPTASLSNDWKNDAEKGHDDIVSDDGSLAETTRSQGDDRPAIDIAEAMRKIMNFTSSVGARKEEDKDDDGDHDEDQGAHYDNPSLSDFDVEEAMSDDAENSDAISEASENESEKNEEPFADILNEVSSILSGSEGSISNNEEADISNDEQDIEEDEDILEDEFGSIPDSFFDEDFSYDDDNSSISALLYDDDDDNADSDFEKSDSISFAKLKEEMQRIKNEAIELREAEENEENEDVAPSSEDVPEENSAETPEEEIGVIENTEESSEVKEKIEDTPEEEIPVTEASIASEKKSYVRDINRKEIKEDERGEGRSEHIITIDRTRIKDKSVPEGRLIDSVFDAAELFTFAFLIIMMLLCFIFRNTTVSGPSMLPTFNDGDRLIISNLFYEPKRGDVVVFDDRTNTAYDDIPIIKRIIGLEGDVVKIEGGIIMVKEAGSDEFTVVDYVYDMDIPYRDMDEVPVGKGEMFVMGDNVNNSLDSTDRDKDNPAKNVGNVKVDSILGKVIFRFYIVETVFSEETQEWVTRGRIVFDTNFTKNKP